MERLGPRRGTATLTRIIATGIPPTRSELEDAVLDLITRGGFAPPDVNKPITVDGRRIKPDFRWPEHRLVVEADGAAWHDHRLAREDDVDRQTRPTASASCASPGTRRSARANRRWAASPRPALLGSNAASWPNSARQAVRLTKRFGAEPRGGP
jgi:hypothetical protein